MTRYEHLLHKQQACEAKAHEAKAEYMRSIWLRHAHELQEMRNSLTLKEAAEVVNV